MLPLWLLTLAATAGCGDATPSEGAGDPLALAQGAPRIDQVSVSGPGCARFRGAVVGISGARDTFRVRFDDLKVDSEGSTRATGCQLAVRLEGEEGVQYAPAGLQLEIESARGRATLTTSGWWTSDPAQTARVTASFGQGRHRTTGLHASTLWSSCSGERELRIQLDLALVDPDGAASVNRARDLSFYARACADADAGVDGGVDAQVDASVGSTDAGERDAQAPMDAAVGDDAGDAQTLDAQGATPVEPDLGAGRVSIKEISASGSGCPSGSATLAISPEGDDFTAVLTQFAVTGEGAQRLRSHDCALTLKVDAPPGTALAIASYTLSGSADLPEGWTTRTETSYSYAALRGGVSTVKLINQAGPRQGAFQAEVAFAEDEVKFRECAEAHRTVTIDLNYFLRGPGTSSAARAHVGRVGNVRFLTRPCAN